jgi:hypothetical protein
MQLSAFLANKNNPHRAAGQLPVKCNSLYVKNGNFNCYLTPSQAVQVAHNILEKAQLILDHEIEDTGVRLWVANPKSGRVYFGLTKLTANPRKAKVKSK